MIFGVHYGYWAKEWDTDVEILIRRAARLGFGILEIGAATILDKTDSELDKLKRVSKECKIQLVCGMNLPAGQDIASLDSAIRQAGVEYLKKIILSADKAGIHDIAGILYTSWAFDASKPIPKETTRKYSIENMKILADFAAEHNTTLHMEVCNRFATYMLNTAQEGVSYVDSVGKDNVKVMLDTFHMNIEEDHFAAAIKTAGKRLGYLHVCESNRKLPGQGHLPWEEITGALKECSYEGPVVMECFVNMEGTIARALKTWRELRPDYDENGKDRDLATALDFLKAMCDQTV